MLCSNCNGLEAYQGLVTLVLDHNSFGQMKGFPKISRLETLSLAYNQLKDLNQLVYTVSQNVSLTASFYQFKYPNLKHLNLIKNPVNPIFQGATTAYDRFRATVKIWCPSLVTLDGTDFTSDSALISKLSPEIERSKQGIINQFANGQQLTTIPENSRVAAGDEDVYEAMKKKQAAGKPDSKATYQFNKTAHRKYNSTKSLFDRILKSNSEGNRFIRNDDL